MVWTTPNSAVIDQSGDAIITLTQLETTFAIWDITLEELSCHKITNTNGDVKGKGKQTEQRIRPTDGWISHVTSVKKKKSKKGKIKGKQAKHETAVMSDSDSESSIAKTSSLTNSTTSNSGDVLGSHEELTNSEAETNKNCDEDFGQVQSEYKPAVDPEPVVSYRISSKHLKMASGKFRSELGSSWSESTKEEDGLYHLTAEGWDPEVFGILLNILHLRNRQVPPNLTLETLAKMAVLVDYYRCWEAVEMWTNIWIEEARKKQPVPVVYSRELILWMLIAWVFELPKEFETTTAIALRQSRTATIQDMCLPIPPPVVAAMELSRYQAIDAVMSICHNWIEKFRDTYKCPENKEWSFSCESILLGALTKEMHGLGYPSPKPEIPFEGYSFESVYRRIKEMKTPQWRSGGGHRYRNYGGDNGWHECTLQTNLGPDIDIVIANTDGLQLYDFKDRAKESEL